MKGFAIRRCVLGSPDLASSPWSNRAITFRSLSRHGSRQLLSGCSRMCSLVTSSSSHSRQLFYPQSSRSRPSLQQASSLQLSSPLSSRWKFFWLEDSRYPHSPSRRRQPETSSGLSPPQATRAPDHVRSMWLQFSGRGILPAAVLYAVPWKQGRPLLPRLSCPQPWAYSLDSQDSRSPHEQRQFHSQPGTWCGPLHPQST